jgi:hypothetical protein
MALLSDYVLRLASDPEEAAEFSVSKTKAEQRMKHAGLNEHQRALLITGDIDGITDEMARELNAAHEIPTNHTTCMVTFDIPKPK